MGRGTVIASVESLAHRVIPSRAEWVKARFRLRIGGLVRDVVVDRGAVSVVAPDGKPDVIISTSPTTWLEIESGTSSGIEAFAGRKLSIRGSIQGALNFEPLFERPDGTGLKYTVERLPVGGSKLSTIVTGPKGGEAILMLHGLGGTKASLLPIVPQLARSKRLYVVDLPGFGASSKPRGRYDAAWFAEAMFAFMDERKLKRVSLIGNSMGGRIAQEMALRDPRRIDAIALLCPATAFAHRPGLPVVRILRPELGIAAGFIPRSRVIATMKSLFADPTRIDEAWYEAAADDFLRTWRSPRARMAFFAALRHIYLDEPYGERGLFTRLARLESRSLYIYGRHDALITPHFARKIDRVVPGARVELWEDCGHVPQLEYPIRTADTIGDFFNAESRAARAG